MTQEYITMSHKEMGRPPVCSGGEAFRKVSTK